jgi:hypothetical protein
MLLEPDEPFNTIVSGEAGKRLLPVLMSLRDALKAAGFLPSQE